MERMFGNSINFNDVAGPIENTHPLVSSYIHIPKVLSGASRHRRIINL